MKELLLKTIATKIQDGLTLQEDEILALFRSEKVVEIDHLAHYVNKKLNDTKLTLHNIRSIYIPEASELCPDKDKIRSINNDSLPDSIATQLTQIKEEENSEIRFSLPKKDIPSLDILISIISILKDCYQCTDLRPFGVYDILLISKQESLEIKDILKRLKDSGCSFINGKGSGIFDDTFKLVDAENYIPFEKWLEVHQQAHEMGFITEASLTYGFDKDYQHRVQSLIRVNELQEKTRGFSKVVLIPYISAKQKPPILPSIEDLKTVSIVRIALQNIKDIALMWDQLGIDFASLTITYGVNNLISDLSKETLPPSTFQRNLDKEEIESIIRKLHYQPEIKTSFHLPTILSEGYSYNRMHSTTNTELLLLKAQKKQDLSIDETLNLVKNTSLQDLGFCSSFIKSEKMNSAHVGMLMNGFDVSLNYFSIPKRAVEKTLQTIEKKGSPDIKPTISLDLGQWQQKAPSLTMERLIAYFKRLHERIPSYDLVIKGIKGIWQLAQMEKLSIEELLLQFKETKLTSIESSSQESEDDLTISEVCGIHEKIHRSDTASVAKVEIAAPYNGIEEPFWEPFINRLVALKELQNRTHGLLGVKIEPARGGNVFLPEYLRAVALARVYLHNVPNIITPFYMIPAPTSTISESMPKSVNLTRIAPLCIYFGSNDFGFIKSDMASLLHIQNELHKAFLYPQRRDGRFYPL